MVGAFLFWLTPTDTGFNGPFNLAKHLLKGEVGERPKADHNIAKVPMPETDPVEGKDRGLVKAWG